MELPLNKTCIIWHIEAELGLYASVNDALIA